MWMLRPYLARALAESSTTHGVFLDVLGMGVLITGDSGVGKSELALELVSRGSGVIADDGVELRRLGPGTSGQGAWPPARSRYRWRPAAPSRCSPRRRYATTCCSCAASTARRNSSSASPTKCKSVTR